MMIVSFNSSAADHDDVIMFTGSVFLSKIFVDNGYSKKKAFYTCLATSAAVEYSWKVAFNIKPDIRDVLPSIPGCYFGSRLKVKVDLHKTIFVSYKWTF